MIPLRNTGRRTRKTAGYDNKEDFIMADYQKLKEEASRLAYEYEGKYGGCSQCVLAAIKETVGGISDDVFKGATGLAGGIGLQGYACGALTGCCIALSCFVGREYANFDDPDRVRFNAFRVCEKLIHKYEEAYGSANCADVQKSIMGRSYKLSIPEDHAAFVAAGGHDDKCTSVCADAVRWTIEIMEEENMLP